MAVAENGGSKIGSSQNSDNTVVSHEKQGTTAINGDGSSNNNQMENGFSNVENEGDKNDEIFKNNTSDLVKILSKLNPMAEEFVPPSIAHHRHDNYFLENGFGFSTENFVVNVNPGNGNGYTNRNVVDCRICGDPNSVLPFAFVEFYKEEDAKTALNLSGTVLGHYPIKVTPSNTAIVPVNPTLLPRSDDEREMCTRTIYCTNIDKKITQADVKIFFDSVCWEVQRLRILGDNHHSSRIAFVEFTLAESATAALNCSGAVLGSLPIRVSPSKTVVRPHVVYPAAH